MLTKLQTDFRTTFRFFERIDNRIVRAKIKAVNKAVSHTRTVARKKLVAQIKPKKMKVVNRELKVSKANRGRKEAVITFHPTHIPLDRVKDVRTNSYIKRVRGGKRRVGKVSYRGKVIPRVFKLKNPKQGNGNPMPKNSIWKQVSSTGGNILKTKFGNIKIRRLYSYSLIQEMNKTKLLKKLSPIALKKTQQELIRIINAGI